MRHGASLIGTSLIAASLLTAGYVGLTARSNRTPTTAPTPRTFVPRTEAPQTGATVRLWTDPPVREQRHLIVGAAAGAALAHAANSSPEPASVETLRGLSELSVPTPVLALHTSLVRPVSQAAPVRRSDKPSRRKVIQTVRQPHRLEPRSISPSVTAESEPVSISVTVEPVQFSLASR